MRSGSPQRTLSAFSPHHYSSSNDPLSQPAFLRAKECSAITATKPKRFRPAHIRDSHPIPLFSWNKNACPFGTAGAVCTASASVRVAHLPQKPVIDSFFIFVFTFPAKRQKDCRFSGSLHPSHTSCFIHGCFHVFDKYQPKSAAEQASCRCNRSLLFVRLPFRIDVCFCPREIFTSKR